jgi:hypothetical protein
MKGAIVFIITFAIFLAVTLAYPELPVGKTISDSIGIDPTVEWSGVPVITLTAAIFNGVVYGIIIWLIFTVLKRAEIIT